MAAMNTLPKTADLTDGYFRRIGIVTFNRQFQGEQVNPNLSRELIAELSGILVWAIEGLKDLRRETRFSIPPSSFEAIEQYRTEADPIREFAEQCLRPSADRSGYTGTQLRNAFIAWGRDRGVRGDSYSTTAFGRALGRMGYNKRLVEPVESAMTCFVTAGVTAEEAHGE